MALVQKAGAIILSEKDPSLVALLYREKQKDWSFPKGHVEQRESVVETMQREVVEETGLSVYLVSEPLPSMEYDHLNGDHILVHMFLMRSENDLELKPEFMGDKIVWVNFEEVTARLSYDNIKKYYLMVFNQIKKTVDKLKSKTI